MIQYVYFGGLKNNKDRGEYCKIVEEHEDGWCLVQFSHRDGMTMVHKENLDIEDDYEDLL